MINNFVRLVYQFVAKQWILMKIQTYCKDEQSKFDELDKRLSAPLSFENNNYIQNQKFSSSSRAIAYHTSYYAIKKTKMCQNWFESAESSLVEVKTKIPNSIHSINEYESAINNCILELRCDMLFR